MVTVFLFVTGNAEDGGCGVFGRGVGAAGARTGPRRRRNGALQRIGTRTARVYRARTRDDRESPAA